MAGLPDYFQLHRWANAQLIDFCEKIDDAVLDAEMAGSVGTIRITIAHLVGVQNEHAAVLVSPPPASYFSSMPFPGWGALREAAAQTDGAFLQAAETREPDETLKSEWQGNSLEFGIMIPLVQYINHGVEHRTQVQSMLSAQGIEPPRLDAWTLAGMAG